MEILSINLFMMYVNKYFDHCGRENLLIFDIRPGITVCPKTLPCVFPVSATVFVFPFMMFSFPSVNYKQLSFWIPCLLTYFVCKVLHCYDNSLVVLIY
jgi:hypothetical protein